MAKLPEGCRSINPYLFVPSCVAALPVYERALGAKTAFRLPGPDPAKTLHAELRFGDGTIMLADADGGCEAKTPAMLGGSAVCIALYVEDVDALYAQAVAAGFKGIMPPADMFWGDRFAKLVDPFGHQWSFSTPKETLTAAEVERRLADQLKKS